MKLFWGRIDIDRHDLWAWPARPWPGRAVPEAPEHQ